MIAYYKEYREKNGVVPYLDIAAYPNGYSDGTTPQPVFSKWALNLKSSGNLDKGAIAASGAKAIGHGMLSILSIGTGTGGVGAGLAGVFNEVGNAVNTAGKSNISSLGMAASLFTKQEKEFWEDYYRLITFEPAQGNLGEEHIGKELNGDRLGYWFYENGNYFEGCTFRNGAQQGIFIFADGLRFYGEYAEGLKIGVGIEIAPDGSRIYGEYVNGELVKGAFQNDQCAMGGQWSGGVLHGSGWARYAQNNAVFVGNWSNGQPVQ